MSSVILENLTKRFGDSVAVDSVNLEIQSGDLFSLVGPSGCGKTTLLRMIAGLERPDSGKIWIGGQLAFSGDEGIFLPPRSRNLGMVFQSYALWPHMTVYDNIAFGLQVRKVPQKDIGNRIREVLELMQIPDLGLRFPGELSGGQQQRVALAREFVTGASTLLMDEPLSNLDARLRMDMRTELKRLHNDTSVTIIYVTHDQLEALTLSTRVAVLNKGKVQHVGTPDEVHERPANLFVSEFIGLNPINIFYQSGGGSGATGGIPEDVRSIVGKLKELTKAEREGVVVGVRPEYLSISDRPGQNSFSATVETVLSAGPSDYVNVLVNGHAPTLRIMIQEFTKAGIEPGAQVHVEVDLDRALVFDSDTQMSLRP